MTPTQAEAEPDPYGDILAGPLHRPLIRLAGPMIAGSVFLMGFNWVDTYFVSRLGEAALAALGSCMFVTWAMISLLEFASIGTLALVSRHIGAKRPQQAGAAAAAGLLLGLALSTTALLISPWLVPALTNLMALEPEPAGLARDYLFVLFWGYPILSLFAGLEAVFRGAGETRFPMQVLGGAFFLNAFIDPILIFGWGPIPALGVRGAALASVLARVLAVAVLGLVLWRGWGPARRLKLSWLGAWWPALAPRLWWRTLTIGAPAGTAGLCFCLIYLLLVRVANSITGGAGGTVTVAALTIGIRLESLAYLILASLGRAAAAIAGQSMGAKNPERAHRAARHAIRLGLLAVLPFTLSMLFVPELLVGIFAGDEQPAVQAAGVTYVRIIALALLAEVFEVVLDQFAAGVGDTVPAMTIEIVGTGLRLPLALGLALWFGLGEQSIFWAVTATMVLKGLAFEVWFRLGRWRSLEL